jgi:hypothetical protein
MGVAIKNKAPDCSEHSTKVKLVIPQEKLVRGKDDWML